MTIPQEATLDALQDKAQDAAEFMRQFSNANRLLLLCHIAAQERSVSDIQEGLGMKQPALSQQLAELRQAGLVKTRRESRTIYYSIADGRIKVVMDMLYGLFCAAPDAVEINRAFASPAAAVPKVAARAVSQPRHLPSGTSGEAAHFARLSPRGLEQGG